MKAKAKAGDIISYHNLGRDEIYFHKVIKVHKVSYTVKCLNAGYTQEGVFDHIIEHKIMNSKLIRLLFE
jgi:hypothetical protein